MGDSVPRARKPRSPNSVKARARDLRSQLTPEESLLWQRLRRRGIGAKFRRQVPIGHFIVDFYCAEARLIIEIDGEPHAEAALAETDAARTAWLVEQDYRVLRFWNRDLTNDTEAVVARIRRELPLSRYAGEGLG
jgi:ATP-dependent helicase HrpA/adenine-specific DNA-methyltransferase